MPQIRFKQNEDYTYSFAKFHGRQQMLPAEVMASQKVLSCRQFSRPKTLPLIKFKLLSTFSSSSAPREFRVTCLVLPSPCAPPSDVG